MRTLLPHDERQDVTLRPAATAKVVSAVPGETSALSRISRIHFWAIDARLRRPSEGGLSARRRLAGMMVKTVKH